MNTRQVLCVALVAMSMAPAFGGLLKDVLVVEALKTAADKHAATTATFANASTPPSVTATGDSKALLYGATVDVDIKKVPLVTVSDAPCKQICKNVCKMEFTKSCSTIPVVAKECTPTKKTMHKQVCSKKCALTYETPKVIKGLSVDTPSNPNPSTPPTAAASATASAIPAPAQLPDLSIHKDLSLSAHSVNADLSVGKGRRLTGVGLIAAKAVVGAELLKSLPVPSCDEVCETVSFEVPDLECQEVTHQVETCKMVPSNNCQQECVCIPQKTFAVNLPKKTLDINISKP